LFEGEVKKYVESFSKQVEQQKATFKLQSAAQLKAWREAADNRAIRKPASATGQRGVGWLSRD
jgi:hypothetical protein